MPRYAPQSLPSGGSRPSMQREANADGAGENMSPDTSHPAIQLGQHIRRERGIQGVQRYVVSMREHLSEDEFEELCQALGVPPDIQLPTQRHAPQTQQHSDGASAQQAQPNPNNNPNMQQMLPMLMQLMNGMQGGGMGMPMGNNGGGNGFNPVMLAQLMQGMNGMQGGGMNNGNMNPLMLAQMLQSMQGMQGK